MTLDAFLDPTRSAFAEFLTELRGQIVSEAAVDPEPENRFSLAWVEWQAREWNRQRLATEIRESELLTNDAADPAPFRSEGLQVFLRWVQRQDLRRKTRGRQ